MLANVVGVLVIRKFFVGAVRFHQAALAVIQIKGAVIGYSAEKTCIDNAHRLYGIQILGKDVLLGEGYGKLGKLQHFVCHRQQFLPFGLGQWFAEPAGHRRYGVNALS